LELNTCQPLKRGPPPERGDTDILSQNMDETYQESRKSLERSPGGTDKRAARKQKEKGPKTVGPGEKGDPPRPSFFDNRMGAPR